MTYEVKNGKYRQKSIRKDGTVCSVYMGKTDRTEKKTKYEIECGEKINLIDEKMIRLYQFPLRLGAPAIARILQEEDDVHVGKNVIIKRLKDLGVYEGDRRKKTEKIDHRAIEEENDIRILALERELARMKVRAEYAEEKLERCRENYNRVRDERNESDRRLRLIDEVGGCSGM